MALAHAAGISPRHMSFVETGRSRPSREVLVRLSEVLGLSFRDRNLLLESAGYARMYRESKLTDLESGRLHEILEFVLARYEPYGAVVVDADWSLLMANRGYKLLMERLMGVRRGGQGDARPNILVELFRPGGVRERLRNWPEVAHHMLERLRRQVADNPLREGLRELLERLESHDLPPRPAVEVPTLPVLPMHFEMDGTSVRLINLITTFGAPQDVTLQELRLEAFLPADVESDRTIRAIVAAEPDGSGAV
jgi:transcriptional regulator with XRE-family HTH domain